MTRCLILLLALIIQQRAFAQLSNMDEKPLAASPKFGDITRDELEMKDCSFEKGASAMNLVNYESIVFTVSSYGDLKLVTETVCRIKIFDKKGFKNASIIIPYTGRNRTSRIIDIDANTYNLDDKGNIATTEINKKDIFRDKAAEKNGLSTVRFTFPDVRVGSVIEYRYTRIEKGSYFVTPWFFQDDIPTQFSACQITMPTSTHLEKHVVASGNDVEEGFHMSKRDNIEISTTAYSYCMRNVPSFKDEPFMTSVKDNLQRIEFSMVPGMRMFGILFNAGYSWNMFNRLFLASPFFGEQFDKPIPDTKPFLDSLKQYRDTPARIDAVCRYVKKHINWDNHYSFYADNLADVWKEKQGNSAEINLSILNLLRKADVECYPLLVSTRDNGDIDVDFPSVGQFNSVDIMAFTKDMLYILDGTEKYLSFRVPPMSVLNRNALIVDEDNSKWIRITDNRTLIKDSVSIVAALDDNGILQGQATFTYYDFSKAARLEKNDHPDDKRDEEDYLANNDLDVKVDTSWQMNKDSAMLPLQEVMKFHYELPSTGDFHFLNPFLFSSFQKNPFTDTGRQGNIDFGARSSFLMHMEITLPEKLKLEELIRNKIIRTPDTTLLFKRTNEFRKNQLVVNSEFTINQAIFDKEDHIAVENFFKTVYALLNEQFVLKRKEE